MTTQSRLPGSCKRSLNRLVADVNHFKRHVDRFLQAMPKYQSWITEFAGISPVLDVEQRTILASHGIIPQDLDDLTAGLA